MPTKKKIYFDQRFTPPRGINKNEYEIIEFGQPLVVSTSWDEGTDQSDDVDSSADATDTTPLTPDQTDTTNANESTSEVSDGKLQAPTNLSIISQTVHQGTTGTTLVDVVIQFDDVPNATKYNARFSKN